MPHRSQAILFTVPLVTLYLGIFLAAAISHKMPKRYESFATVEIKIAPEAPDLSAEKQRFASPDLHTEVSQSMDLPRRWSLDPDSAMRQLEKSIHVRQIRGTDLLKISARSTHPAEAVEILEVLLTTYGKERMNKWEQSDEQKQRSSLRDAIVEQERKVTELRQRLTGTRNDITHPALDVNEFKEEQRRLQEMRLEFLGDALGGPGWTPENPYTGMVVHDDPVPGEFPVSPNHYFNLTLGALLGLFSGIPLALAATTLLHRMRPAGAHPQLW